MEQASYHSSGDKDFEVSHRFLENLFTSVLFPLIRKSVSEMIPIKLHHSKEPELSTESSESLQDLTLG